MAVAFATKQLQVCDQTACPTAVQPLGEWLALFYLYSGLSSASLVIKSRAVPPSTFIRHAGPLPAHGLELHACLPAYFQTPDSSVQPEWSCSGSQHYLIDGWQHVIAGIIGTGAGAAG